jgi:hypothetical protein
MGLLELGPGGFLVVETRSDLQELGPSGCVTHGTLGGLWGLGPDLGFGS